MPGCAWPRSKSLTASALQEQTVTLNDLLAAQDLLEKLDWDVERLLAAVDGLKTLRRPR